MKFTDWSDYDGHRLGLQSDVATEVTFASAGDLLISGKPSGSATITETKEGRRITIVSNGLTDLLVYSDRPITAKARLIETERDFHFPETRLKGDKGPQIKLIVANTPCAIDRRDLETMIEQLFLAHIRETSDYATDAAIMKSSDYATAVWRLQSRLTYVDRLLARIHADAETE